MAGLALGLAGYAVPGQAGSSAQPPAVYLIRHGEKVSHVGCLNQTGTARAAMLPKVFDGRSAFRVPDALFAYEYPNPICQRCHQTLEPIAKAYHLSVGFQPGGLPGEDPATTTAAAAIRHALLSYRTILVAWEHHQLPSLATAFGVPSESLPGAPTDEDVAGGELWPASDFDTVYLLTFPAGASGPANFTVASEGLVCHAHTCRRTEHQVERARSPAAGALEPFPQPSL